MFLSKLIAVGMSIFITLIVGGVEEATLGLTQGMLLCLICFATLFCALSKLEVFDFPPKSFFSQLSHKIAHCHFSSLRLKHSWKTSPVSKAIIYPFPSKGYARKSLDASSTKKACPSSGYNTPSRTHWLS